MKTIKLIMVLYLVVSAVLQASVANAAEVRKISREIVQKVNGKPVLKVRVTCAEVDGDRVIVQLRRSGPWCSADLPNACFKQKLKAAKKVCGTHFERSLNEYLTRAEPITSSAVIDKEDAKAQVLAENVAESNVPSNSDVEIAAVEVPLTDKGGVDLEDDELEKRYEEFVEKIDF